MTKLWWKLPINPGLMCAQVRGAGGSGEETICWEYCSRHTPAHGPVDKMSNVPVKVFMPNLIMLMKPGLCRWGWPQILAVMVTTPRNFRSSLLLIKKGPTFIFTLHTSYPCTKQSMQTCSHSHLKSFPKLSFWSFQHLPSINCMKVYTKSTTLSTGK